MQAKIIDFASDKIAKTLNKINKNDVKNAVTNVKGRWQNRSGSIKNSKSADNLKNVTSSEEYCDMLQNEFKLEPKQNKQLEASSERNDGKIFTYAQMLATKTPKVYAIYNTKQIFS